MNSWQQEERDYLLRNYGKLPASEIAIKLNRTTNGVFHKASRSGLKAISGWENINDYSQLSDLQKGWIAGILDGEGWIGCDKRSRRITIQVTNTSTEMIDELYRLCGGGRYTPKPPKNEKHKQQYVWALSRRENVLNLLTSVYPFLTSKREAAKRAFVHVGS